jgi:hypothetical protein
MVFGLWRSGSEPKSTETIETKKEGKEKEDHEFEPLISLTRKLEESLVSVEDDGVQEKEKKPAKPAAPKETIENPFQIICPPHVTKSSSMRLRSKWIEDSKEPQFEEAYFPILRYKIQLKCAECKKTEWAYVYDAPDILEFARKFGSHEFHDTLMTFLSLIRDHPSGNNYSSITKHTCLGCNGYSLRPCKPNIAFDGEFVGYPKPLHEQFDLQKMAEYTIQFPPNLRRFALFEQGKKFMESTFLQEVKIDKTQTPSPKDLARKEMVENDRGTYFNETGLHVNASGQIVSDLALSPGEIRDRLDGFEFFPQFTDERLGVPRQWTKLKTTKKLLQQVKEPEEPKNKKTKPEKAI